MISNNIEIILALVFSLITTIFISRLFRVKASAFILRLGCHIVYFSVTFILATSISSQFPIKGTVIEDWINENIIQLQFTPYVLANIVLSITGVSAMWFVQSDNRRIQRWGCVLGLLGQPLWFYIAITNNAGGIFFMSCLYTVVWLKGLNQHWIQPYFNSTEQRRSQGELNIPQIGVLYIWDGERYLPVVSNNPQFYTEVSGCVETSKWKTRTAQILNAFKLTNSQERNK